MPLVPSSSDRYTVGSSEETAQAKVGVKVDGEVVFTTEVKMPGVDEEVGGAVVVLVEVLTPPYVEVLTVVELDVVLAVVVLEVVLSPWWCLKWCSRWWCSTWCSLL